MIIFNTSVVGMVVDYNWIYSVLADFDCCIPDVNGCDFFLQATYNQVTIQATFCKSSDI